MASIYKLNMAAPPEVYQSRRGRLAKELQRPLLLFAGRAAARNYAANPFPFRAGSTYLYYGGPPVEGAALLIDPGSDGDTGCTLFRDPPGADDPLWIGEPIADADLAAAAGVAPGRVLDSAQLTKRVGQGPVGSICPPCLATATWAQRLKVIPADDDELQAIVDMRLIKDDHELACLRRAADIAVQLHRAAMAATAPGKREADVAAAMYSTLLSRQAKPSFTPIATIRGEILHIQIYPNRIENDGLMLVDAGAEEPCGYASDVTRTFPTGGKWTLMQRQLYDTTLRAMHEGIAACTPGTRYRDIHDIAARVICEGLVEAELLRGDPQQLCERKAHTLFFPHGVGHLIGLDVHDMEDFGDLAGYAPGRTRRQGFGDKSLRLDRDLLPGMYVTIEPGIYLVPAIWERSELVSELQDVINRPAIDALLAQSFGGIRIEEDVLVTDGDPDVLTAALPSDPEKVAECVGQAI